MGKVVTSQGLNEFVQSGKFEEIKPDKPIVETQAPPLEVKKEQAPQDVKPPEEPVDEHKDEDPETQAEIDKSERFRKAMNRKHYALKQAEAQLKKVQDEMAESERFSELQYNERRQAEAKLAQLEKELAEMKTKEAPKAPEVKEPDPQTYYDDKGQFKAFEYAKDLAGYESKKAIAEYEAKQQAAQAAAAEAQAKQAFGEKVNEARKKYSDFDEVVGKADMTVPAYVQQHMVESQYGADLGYLFAKQPEILERISKLSPIKAIAELGKLELAFEKPAPAKEPEAPVPQKAVSGAPPPITPLPTSSSVNVNTDPAKMDFKQLRAFERERMKRRS